ncbi:MAG: hypothetical protein NVSMB49_21670 [Ktedonobacteraceae bacterium]
MTFWPLLICLISTFYFVGLIWTIQILSYPLFQKVGRDAFADYHAAHSQRITLLLGLPLLLVFVSSLLMLWIRPANVPLWAVLLNGILGGSVWIMTAFIHVPLHSRLGKNYSLNTMQTLVTTNWLRTIVWTVQGLLLLWMMGVGLHS